MHGLDVLPDGCVQAKHDQLKSASEALNGRVVVSVVHDPFLPIGVTGLRTQEEEKNNEMGRGGQDCPVGYGLGVDFHLEVSRFSR